MYKPRSACRRVVERVEGGAVAEPEKLIKPERLKESAARGADWQIHDPEHDADDADRDCQRRDAKRKLAIAGQHEHHRGDRERDLDRVDDRVLLDIRARTSSG